MSAEAELTAAGPKAVQRDPAFDLARGFGIICVLIHHWSSSASRLYTTPKGLNWWLLGVTNRLTTFTVPLFLFVSCILAARSLAKNPDPIRFYRARLPGIIYPYLVWTVIFWILTMLSSPAARHLHNGIPEFFAHPMARLSDLVWGKASFHLYFLVVLIQVMLFMPLLFWKPIRGFVDKLTSGAGSTGALMALTFLAIQVALQALQHYVLKLPYPASTFIWYPSAWWLALLFAKQTESPAKTLSPFGLQCAALIILFVYAKDAFMGAAGVQYAKGDWISENLILALYCGAVSWIVFVVCTKARTPYKTVSLPWLEWLGRNSLQIYLIHVIWLDLLGRGPIERALEKTHAGPVLELVLMVLITLASVIGIKAFKLEKPLFGRTT